MKYELKKVGIFSVIKISFIIGGLGGFLGGLIAGMFFAAFASLIGSMGSMAPELDSFGDMSGGIGIIAVIFMPLVYGFVGAIFSAIYGAIGGAVYNLAARLFGGLEWEMVAMEAAPPAASAPPPPPEQPKRVPPSMYE